ncbi:putative pentatricopeptide repeat-containing protein At3g13770, mitochondrial [Zingiber officinale]|uniref:putative pentatricopeptide repeat-containing protein At3g13770, mitochondrial n=1 Tax=Zingiber officinale TaxID=94328 RepID=UPI001C4AE50D|nr:putative pentatricopeptide repeat-containing protein At3g13770, mitochondrial [Zingiber officinale]
MHRRSQFILRRHLSHLHFHSGEPASHTFPRSIPPPCSTAISFRVCDSIPPMATFGLADYDDLLRGCTRRRAIKEGRVIHAHMIKSHFVTSVRLANRLLVMYVKGGSLEDARQVLDGMSQRDVISWTAMMSGYSQHGRSFEALEQLPRMLRTGILPNEYTLATVLPSCTGHSGQDHGRQIHSLAVKSNFDSHMFVGSSLLDMYSKVGEVKDARRVFNMLPHRDVVSCTAIISGYAQSGLDEEALKVFQQLQREGMECNYVTFVSLLTAIAGLAALDFGRQVHGLVIRSELLFYVVLDNSLIDMYSKCGSLKHSRRVFDNMPERSVISWNTMLMGYGKHGLGREVVQLFKSMFREVKPNGVTFLAVLSGCSHGGLIDEGLDIFGYMVSDQRLKPEIGHYGCLVDLLGRAGRIEEALDVIKNMPYEPTSALWNSLLGACRLHAKISIGEVVARKLLDMEPDNASNYVILSNIYAASGRWQDVARVRESMKLKKLTKEPGRSSIQLDKVMHIFFSSDRSHPRRKEIFDKITEVCERIKAAGYVPDLSCVLHDVDDEQKESILLGHSEKLAIAFGLMGNACRESIRITKNLRICIDCHNFAKYVSNVYQMEISLRDSSRFHLVAGGACSCGDYW